MSKDWKDLTEKEKKSAKQKVAVGVLAVLFMAIGEVLKELDKIYLPKEKYKSNILYNLRWFFITLYLGAIGIGCEYFGVSTFVSIFVFYVLIEIPYYLKFKRTFLKVSYEWQKAIIKDAYGKPKKNE